MSHYNLDIALPEAAQQLLQQVAQKPKADLTNAEALRVVRAVWPMAFHVSSPRPLKIGIHQDMEQTGVVPAPIIRVALRFFTTWARYLENIQLGVFRIDLQGKPCGKVRLREVVDAEIKLFQQSQMQNPQRQQVVIQRIRLLSVNGVVMNSA